MVDTRSGKNAGGRGRKKVPKSNNNNVTVCQTSTNVSAGSTSDPVAMPVVGNQEATSSNMSPSNIVHSVVPAAT